LGHGTQKIVVNANFASKASFWGKVSFLPENVYDYRFYLRIALYKKNLDARFRGVSLSFEPEQAGGSRAIDIFSIRGRDCRFIFALLDSDLNSPFDSLRKDSTAGKFKEKFSPDVPWPNACYHILEVHEIENLFSSAGFLAKVNPAKSKILDSYSSEIRQYYDLKNGYSYKSLQRNCYMRGQVKGRLPVCSKHSIIDKCKLGGFKCEMNIMPGFGKILPNLFGESEESALEIETKVLKEFDSSFDLSFDQLIDPVKQEWTNIYENFLTYFCAVPIVGAGF